jgi:hypothetical protein
MTKYPHDVAQVADDYRRIYENQNQSCPIHKSRASLMGNVKSKRDKKRPTYFQDENLVRKKSKEWVRFKIEENPSLHYVKRVQNWKQSQPKLEIWK